MSKQQKESAGGYVYRWFKYRKLQDRCVPTSVRNCNALEFPRKYV